MRARTKRLYAVGFAAILVASAAVLASVALRRHADLFYTPALLAERGMPEQGQRVRIGGFVETGSLTYGDGAELYFIIEDGSGESVRVTYTGIVPDLFREGEGVVATGAFGENPEVFEASEILAKHDETYQPRELRDLEAPDAGT
ncbi:MAG: cytochrome c maturation protein CcmE [Henriciella sp.]|nr:cytochrome c maturation protein CcmE [Henriciella sp.]